MCFRLRYWSWSFRMDMTSGVQIRVPSLFFNFTKWQGLMIHKCARNVRFFITIHGLYYKHWKNLQFIVIIYFIGSVIRSGGLTQKRLLCNYSDNSNKDDWGSKDFSICLIKCEVSKCRNDVVLLMSLWRNTTDWSLIWREFYLSRKNYQRDLQRTCCIQENSFSSRK